MKEIILQIVKCHVFINRDFLTKQFVFLKSFIYITQCPSNKKIQMCLYYMQQQNIIGQFMHDSNTCGTHECVSFHIIANYLGFIS